MTLLDTEADRLECLCASIGGMQGVAEGMAAEQKTMAFFAGMPEPARRKLGPQVSRLHKAAVALLGDMDARGRRHLDAGLTSVALAATATIADLRKIGFWYPSAAFCRALVDRRPDWLAEGIELVLDRMTSSHGIGPIAEELNRLVAQGLIEMPRHDHYAIGVAYAYDYNPKLPPLVDRLRADIDRLVPAIWRQFEVEGGGEISLANFDKFRPGPMTWSEALTILAAEGHLDRKRLLEASLDALNRGFSQYRAGWFSRFHETLAPTLDERVGCTGRYLDLLASPIGPTVTLAVSALKVIDKAGRLGVGEIVERIAPALHAKSAATVKSALALLVKAARSDPRRRSAVLELAAIGLEHSSSEVQVLSLDLIEQHADALDDASRRAIAERLDMIGAPLRPRAQVLLGDAVPAATASPSAVPCNEAATLAKRAKNLPPDLARLAGVDAALAALEGGACDIARAPFDGMDIPRLDPARRIVPISTFEGLVDHALAALEHPDDLDRVEAVLAGALRFAAGRPADASQLLGPLGRLLKRFQTLAHDELATPRGSLVIVLSALFDQETAQITIAEDDPQAVLVLRSDAMAAAIRDRRTCVQLSAPTHAGHWIDPVALVERSLALSKIGTSAALGLADEILALLRLAPDDRARALKTARSLAGEWGAALRYALGGDAPMGETKPLWAAAARARSPFGDDAQLARLIDVSAPGLDLPPRFSYATLERQGGWLQIGLVGGGDGKPIGFGKDGYTCRPTRSTAAAAPARCFPTQALADPATLCRLDTYVPGDMRHRASWGALPIWPQNPEPAFALSALAACMLDGNNYVKPANEPLAEGLKAILDPDLPAGEMALLMLCRGLNAIDKAAAQAAVDAAIAMIDDGRIDGSQLGGAMHGFLMSGLVVAKRWPDRLKDAARSSPLGLLVVTVALERALQPGVPKHPLRDMHAWLETLLELSIELGREIENPDTREGIRRFLGSGKAGKPAQALLKLKASKSVNAHRRAALHALRARSARAERWLAALSAGRPKT
jgi:hypothetical protein